MTLVNQFNVGRPPTIHPGDRQNIPAALNLDGVVFEKPGTYCFTTKINDEEVNRLLSTWL